jgi:hypothetical protein
MTQQGFMAVAVSSSSGCQFQQLDAESDPPLVRTMNSVEIMSGGQVAPYTAVSFTTTCKNGETVQYGEL